MGILKRDFFARDTLTVARELLGKRLVRPYMGLRLSGMVAETEAYLGSGDSASHAFKGKTPRNRLMFGPAGMAYVYLVYGLHHLFNVTTEAPETAGAVLVRAIAPLEGRHKMMALRGHPARGLADGPGKLCRALAIDRSLNGWDLTRRRLLWFEALHDPPRRWINAKPRVGIAYAAPQDRQAPWRFALDAAALAELPS